MIFSRTKYRLYRNLRGLLVFYLIIFALSCTKTAEASGWEVLRLRGSIAGPKLLLVAGIHGNEPSGPRATRLFMSGPPPERGELVAVPAACPEALAVGKRLAPGWSDLNRAFPHHRQGMETHQTVNRPSAALSRQPASIRAEALLDFISAEKPDLVLDLHESSPSWTEGNAPTLVIPRSPAAVEIALELLESPELGGFSFTGPPPTGSLATAVNDLLGIPALIIEVPSSLKEEARLTLHLSVIKTAWRILTSRTE